MMPIPNLTAQNFVDALREGNFAQVAGIKKFLEDKYSYILASKVEEEKISESLKEEIKQYETALKDNDTSKANDIRANINTGNYILDNENGVPILLEKKQITAEDLLPILIYELASTDVNENDLIILATLNSAFRPFSQVEECYTFTTLMGAVQYVIPLRLFSEFEQVPTQPTPDLFDGKSILNKIIYEIDKIQSPGELQNKKVAHSPEEEEIQLEITTKVKQIFGDVSIISNLPIQNTYIKQYMAKFPVISKFPLVKYALLLDYTQEYRKEVEKDIHSLFNSLFDKCSLLDKSFLQFYGTGKGAHIQFLCRDVNKLRAYPTLQKAVKHYISVVKFIENMKNEKIDAFVEDMKERELDFGSSKILGEFKKDFIQLKKTATPTPGWKAFAAKVGSLLNCFSSIGIIKKLVDSSIFQKPAFDAFKNKTALLLSPSRGCC